MHFFLNIVSWSLFLLSSLSHGEAIDGCALIHFQFQSADTLPKIQSAYFKAISRQNKKLTASSFYTAFALKCLKIGSDASVPSLEVARSFKNLAETFLAWSQKNKVSPDFLAEVFESALSLTDLTLITRAIESNDISRVGALRQHLLDQRDFYRKHYQKNSHIVAPALAAVSTPKELLIVHGTCEYKIATQSELGDFRFNGGVEWSVKTNLGNLKNSQGGEGTVFELVTADQLSREGEKFLGVGDLSPLIFPSEQRGRILTGLADLVSVIPSPTELPSKGRIREVKLKLKSQSIIEGGKQLQSTLLGVKMHSPSLPIETCELVVEDTSKNRNVIDAGISQQNKPQFLFTPVEGRSDTFYVKNADGSQFSFYALGEEIPYTVRLIPMK